MMFLALLIKDLANLRQNGEIALRAMNQLLSLNAAAQ
jgi:hypothetical protein